MALFNKRDLLESAGLTSFANTADRYYAESTVRAKLSNRAASYSSSKTYDIFLSHSYDDKVVIESLAAKIEKLGYTVYVDWIQDPHLDRTHVTRENAEVVRVRMKNCKSLLYATSENAAKSNWMPWELGYFDGLKGRVAVAPIAEDRNSTDEFSGREYLGLYPYVVITGDTALYIHNTASSFVRFPDWLTGNNPR
ncbi:MAG: hypothetical protein ABSH14_11480 [Verrucomicrobiia bacterium]